MITQDYLKSALQYDPETGIFIWLHRPGLPKQINSRRTGVVAGSAHSDGYRIIRIDRVTYLAHRLAWLYVHGEWPVEIDHIDRDRANNVLSNLRSVPHSVNSVNKRVISASGYKGVTRHRFGKWQAQISRLGQQHYLGLFDDKIAAAKAYRNAARILHGKWTADMPELARLGEASDCLLFGAVMDGGIGL